MRELPLKGCYTHKKLRLAEKFRDMLRLCEIILYVHDTVCVKYLVREHLFTGAVVRHRARHETMVSLLYIKQEEKVHTHTALKHTRTPSPHTSTVYMCTHKPSTSLSALLINTHSKSMYVLVCFY